jgi:hypothetical protein
LQTTAEELEPDEGSLATFEDTFKLLTANIFALNDAYSPSTYRLPDESHEIDLNIALAGIIPEYWYTPDESNFEKKAVVVEVVGNVPREVPDWFFIFGVPMYLPAIYTFPSESVVVAYPSSSPAAPVESTILANCGVAKSSYVYESMTAVILQ